MMRHLNCAVLIVFLTKLSNDVLGLDYIKHGEVAYPNKSQGDGWYNRRYSMDLTSRPPPPIMDIAKKLPKPEAIQETGESKACTQNIFL